MFIFGIAVFSLVTYFRYIFPLHISGRVKSGREYIKSILGSTFKSSSIIFYYKFAHFHYLFVLYSCEEFFCNFSRVFEEFFRFFQISTIMASLILINCNSCLQVMLFW